MWQVSPPVLANYRQNSLGSQTLFLFSFHYTTDNRGSLTYNTVGTSEKSGPGPLSSKPNSYTLE